MKTDQHLSPESEAGLLQTQVALITALRRCCGNSPLVAFVTVFVFQLKNRWLRSNKDGCPSSKVNLSR